MSTLNEDLVRVVLNGLKNISRNGTYALTPETRELFAEITPIEVENITNACRRHVSVDILSIERELNRIRREPLVRDLIVAGASNSLIRELFGLSVRDIARLRTDTCIHTPPRRRLKPCDARRVSERKEQNPPGDTPLSRSVWSLEVARDLGLPLMSVYQHINTTTRQHHEQK